MKSNKLDAAIIGARGFVGQELLLLLDQHKKVSSITAYSRQHKGEKIASIVKSFSDKETLYEEADFDSLASKGHDVLFLALPNGLALKYNHLWKQISQSTCVIDLSSDFRFEDKDWLYSQPETCQQQLINHKLISNPGCYATAAQLGLLPLIEYVNSPPVVFGVSGYSGAGSQPCDKNNPELLRDNLMAYKMVDHIHEREVSRVLNQTVYFTPHVASFFRGIHLTIHLTLAHKIDSEEIIQVYKEAYKEAELIKVFDSIPEVRNIQNTHEVHLGGFSVQGNRIVLCVTIDNLLKGAATQAIQNMNLSFSHSHDLTINSYLKIGG